MGKSSGSSTVRSEPMTTADFSTESVTFVGRTIMLLHFTCSLSSPKKMYQHLLKDPENVVVIHCNAGKGRTGTAITVLLLFSHFVNTIDEANKFYGIQRFSSGVGVT
mmetsp:Transcript_319/g.349  ORF Transcript_319/g.349 Transcript_319/m.349 type:complete len:107 (+) Transcript_319:180-500(+)